MARTIDVILSLTNRFTKPFEDSIKAMTSGTKSAERAWRNVEKAGDKIDKKGKQWSRNITLPLIGLGTMAVKSASDMQNGLAKVSTIADDLDMAKLEEETLKYSRSLGILPEDFSNMQYAAISAGASMADSWELVAVSEKAAEAGFTNGEVALDGITSAYNAFEGVVGYSEIGDKFMQTQNLGKTTFGELAQSFGQVAPIANAAGMSIDETLAATAALTKNGLDTSSAMTSLKGALSNIVKPSKQAQEAAETLGIDFSASALESKGFGGMIEDIKKALENASPGYAKMSEKMAENMSAMEKLEQSGQKNSQAYKDLKAETKETERAMQSIASATDSPISGFATLFGSIQGLNGMLTLAGSGADDYNEALIKMSDSTGLVESGYEKMQTPSVMFHKSLNNLKTSLVPIGNKLMPFMERAVVVLGQVADKIAALSPEQQDLIIKMGLAAAAAGPLTSGFGKIISGVGATGKKVVGITRAFGKFSTGLKGVSKGAKVVKFAIAGITSPVSIVIGVVAALIGVVLIVRKNWDTFKKSLNKTSPVIVKLKSQFSSIAKKLSPIIKITKKVGSTIFNVFGKVITVAVSAAIAYFGGFLTGVATVVEGIIDVFRGIVDFITGVFTGDWEKAWTGVKEIFGGIFDSITGIARGVINGVSSAINAVVGVINGAGFTIPDWVPVVGGKSFEINIPEIPMLAKGTDSWKGGIAQISEKGGEIVDLPSGSRVYPHDESVKKARSEGGFKINIAKLADSIMVREEADIDKIATALAQKLVTKAKTMGGARVADMA